MSSLLCIHGAVFPPRQARRTNDCSRLTPDVLPAAVTAPCIFLFVVPSERRCTKEAVIGIFTSEQFNSREELLEHELRDLYDAEHRLTDALPKLAEKASNPELKRAFESHLRETEKHVERLESIFEHLGIDADREKCD